MSESPKRQYRANFLWRHEEGSIEEAGYEFANASTAAYAKKWWAILLERAAQALVGRMPKVEKHEAKKLWVRDNFREIPKEDFIQRLIDAGWSLKDAEKEWKSIQNEEEGGL